MNDALLVRGVERLGNLARDRESLSKWNRSAGQPLRKRRPLDQLENNRMHGGGR